MNEYGKQATDFLAKANAAIRIDFLGPAINTEWDERKQRNLYEITITTPRGSMTFNFWDSIHNTEIKKMSLGEYAERRFKARFDCLSRTDRIKAKKELEAKKTAAVPTAYDVLACMTKYNPGTFKEFCADYGYDDDSRTAERMYFAVQDEYTQLTRLFTEEQMSELCEIQ